MFLQESTVPLYALTKEAFQFGPLKVVAIVSQGRFAEVKKQAQAWKEKRAVRSHQR